MEKVNISQKFYERGRGYSININDDDLLETATQKGPEKRKTTALDTFMVVDKIKVTKFQ